MNDNINLVRTWLPSVIIAASIILAGGIIQRLIIFYIHRYAKKTHWKGGLVVISSLRGMIVLIAILVGINAGLSYSPLTADTLHIVQKVHKGLVLFIVTFIIARVLTGLLNAYTNRDSEDKSSISLFKSIINIIVYTVGGLIILGAMGISITPIITALGIGGLAVALALQNTLSNLFSGIQITIAHNLKPGDYIILDSNQEGTIRDIAWRSTTLLTLSGNIVVIPNSKIADSIVTNCSLPTKIMTTSLIIGIAYGSDLDKVEAITMEVVRDVMKELGVTDGEPFFRYKEFADSSINFSVGVTVHDFKQQYPMKHTLIKRLYKRFNNEGIEIPFPIRTVYMKKEE